MCEAFEKLEIKLAEKSTIFLDIDGTITADSSSEVCPSVFQAIQNLVRENVVYLLSNYDDPRRNQALAARLGVRYANTAYKKPSRRILEALPAEHRNQPIVVIGDKLTVDGWFALRIGARFVKVRRIASPHDRWITKLACRLDDLVSGLWDFRGKALGDRDRMTRRKTVVDSDAP